MPPIRRSPELEINLNTWVAVAGFATTIFLGGIAWQSVRSTVEEHTKLISEAAITLSAVSTRVAQLERDGRDEMTWRAGHEENMRDRRGEIQSAIASAATQRNALDERLDAQEALSSRFGDRMVALDAQGRELTGALREMQRAIAEQGGDLRWIRAAIEKPEDKR